MPRLSIVIPVYNEEKAIGETVAFFTKFLHCNPDSEVIFANDASTDGTARILARINNERIKVINNPVNEGYGSAIKRGVKNSSGDYIAVTDADGSYPNKEIPTMFEGLVREGAEMIVGSRGKSARSDGLARRTAKFILKKLAEYLSGKKIPDLNSGLRIAKKSLIMKFLRFLPNGFSFTSTLTLSSLAGDHKIIYHSIDYRRRKGKSKIRPLSDTLNFLQLIIRTAMFFNPLKVFLPASIFFIFLSFAVLITTYFLGKVMDLTTIILFTTGLNLLAIGLLADLIDKRLNR